MIKTPKINIISFVSCLLCFLLLGAVFSEPLYVFADDAAEATDYYQPNFDLRAGAAIVINNNTGFVLYEREADLQLPAASLVKMVTAMVVRSKVADIDAETVTAQTWIFNELFGREVSHADIWNGETLTVRELLYALILPSANEAALMLASYSAGGYVTNFVRMMNSKVAALGCTGTVFADASGLSENSVTTARDMAIIVNAFLADELLASIAKTAVYEMAAHNHTAPYYIHNTNRLIVPEDLYAHPFSGISTYIKGGKTGNLGEWQSFASVAAKNEVEYTVVVLQSPNDADAVGVANDLPSRRPALYESSLLYKWAFENFGIGSACDTTQPIYEIPVKYSTDASSVHLLPAESLQTILPVGISEDLIQKEFHLPVYLAAPIGKGQAVGYITLSIQGRVLGKVELVAAKTIGINPVLFMIQKIGEFFSTLFFKVFVGYILLFGAGYGFLTVHFNKEKKRKAAMRARRGQGRKK